MSNLQPLKWVDNVATAAGRSYTIHKTVSGNYYTRIYNMMTQSSSDSAMYDTLDEVKHFSEFEHYIPKTTAEFLTPSPTWVKATEQLPTHHQDVIVYRYNKDNDEGGSINHSLYFDGEILRGFGNLEDEEGFYDDVYYWQPIETKLLYEAMAMQLQISEVTK